VIRYPITKAELERQIERFKPGWLQRARSRTESFRLQGFYRESNTIWGEIKAIYIRLQHAKCAYCEKQLEDEERGKSEHDVEHFRPKSSVAKWRVTNLIRDANIPFTPPTSGSSDPGYHLLAYHLFNYATACKPCNSALKGNKFPIAETRKPNSDDPADLRSEKAYLIYPISDVDYDPKKLIRFHGVSPQPVFRSGHRRNRAIVTIAFFELDIGKRQKTFFRQRAEVIT
jgi:5-methylcytosine-specific restriction endonuclease McrA